MFESVLNPLAWWGMVAVSVPIIIHLINRLRYRRIHWAAMEFLLKAMQKNKRKLLLEQLLLLLLRCLIVALVVLLIIRPTWFLGDGGGSGSSQYHLVLLDDSLSMRDREDAKVPDSPDAFKRATKGILDLAQSHAEGAGSHYWSVLTFSTPEAPELGTAPSSASDQPAPKMTSEQMNTLKERLDNLKPTYLPLSPLAVLKEATKHLERAKEGRKFLHIYSDFRRADWASGNQELLGMIADLAKTARVKVKLHDVAIPERTTATGEVPAPHGNLSLAGLAMKPRRTAENATVFRSDLPLRTVTPRKPFDIHVTLKNWSETERRNVRLVVHIEGTERTNRIVDRLAGGEERVIIFNLEFGPDELPGLKSVQVRAEDSEFRDHLAADDTAYGFIELEKEVPVLVVDADARLSDTVTDTLFLSAALTGSIRTGVKVDAITPRELTKKIDLARYPVIYVCNVAGIGRGEGDLEEEGLKKLESYAKSGGSVVFFLGPRTNVTSWNEKFYRQGKGIFPVPLLTRPDPEGRKSLPYIDEQPDEMDTAIKLRFLRPHPAFPFTGDITELLTRYIHVNRYFRVDPQWKPLEGSNSVLVQLSNRRPLLLYRDEAQTLANEVRALAGGNAKIVEYTRKLAEAVIDAETKKARKGDLIEAVSGLIGDPQLAEFWKDKKNITLKDRIDKFLSTITLGDPLVIEGKMQSGNILAFLTPASPRPIQGLNYPWNDMSIGDLGQFFYVPMLLGLQDQMASLSRGNTSENSVLLGKEPIELRLDPDRYNPQVEVWYQNPHENKPVRVDMVTGENAKADTVSDKGDWIVRIKPNQGPGHYRLKFNQLQGGSTANTQGDLSLKIDASKVPEERPLAVNVDGRVESRLDRISEDQMRESLAEGLSQVTKLSPAEAKDFSMSKNWFTATSGESKDSEQTSSWSDYSWILFLFLGLLALEQFLAVKFSHHV